MEGESAVVNFNQNTVIATQPRVVVRVEGDEQTEEHLHQHHQEGGQGGSSDQNQLPAVRKKAEPWKAKARRRGVKKDSLVQSRLENFVK